MSLLYFPQWQGAADRQRYPLEQSAARLRSRLLKNHKALYGVLQEVPLQAGISLELEQEVWGRHELLQQFESISTMLETSAPRRIGMLGGDCAVELAPVSHLNRLYGDHLALLWVDAHADLNLPETSPSHALHGMPLRMLLGEGDAGFTSRLHPLCIQQVGLVGVRDVDLPEKVYIEQNEMALFPAFEGQVDCDALYRWLKNRGTRQVYFHLDLDVLDPALFPQVGFPAPGGLSVTGVTRLLRILDDGFELVGFSMTEYLSPQGQGLEALDPLLKILATFGD